MKGFTTLRKRMVAVGIAAFALTALAAAQTPDVRYSWAAPEPVLQSQPAQPAQLSQTIELANSVTANNAFAPEAATPEMQSDYRGIRGARGQDVLGTINDVVYGRPHTARTIAPSAATSFGT